MGARAGAYAIAYDNLHTRSRVRRRLHSCWWRRACVGDRGGVRACLRSVGGKLHRESCCYMCALAGAYNCACDTLHVRARVRLRLHTCGRRRACVCRCAVPLGSRQATPRVLLLQVRPRLWLRSALVLLLRLCCSARFAASYTESLAATSAPAPVCAYASALALLLRLCCSARFAASYTESLVATCASAPSHMLAPVIVCTRVCAYVCACTRAGGAAPASVTAAALALACVRACVRTSVCACTHPIAAAPASAAANASASRRNVAPTVLEFT